MKEPLDSLFEAAPKRRGESGSGVHATPQFAVLQASPGEKKRRSICFGAGSLVQVLLASAFLFLLTLPPALREDEVSSGNFVLLAPPPEIPARKPVVAPPPPLPPKQTPPPTEPEPVKAQTPKIEPKPVLPRVTPPVTAKLTSPPTPAPPAAPAVKLNVPRWKPETHVGGFNSAPTVATLKLPKAEVQTGGFGAASGLPGEAEGGSHGNVPHVGSFDRPEGPGSGNGAGGMHGSETLVASAGFGNGMSGAGSMRGNGSAGDGQVRSAGFADAQTLARPAPQAKSQPAAASFEPVEITAKPDPVYTAEARSQQIQGEVLVRVVFTAAGRVQVLGVQQGPGHGLDEAAMRAAEQIQFKPARRGGQPVDVTATLHITFQLAN